MKKNKKLMKEIDRVVEILSAYTSYFVLQSITIIGGLTTAVTFSNTPKDLFGIAICMIIIPSIYNVGILFLFMKEIHNKYKKKK